VTSQGGSGVDEERPKGYSWPDCLFVAQLPAPFGGGEEEKSSWKMRVTRGPARDLGSRPVVQSCVSLRVMLDLKSRSCGFAGPHRPPLWRPVSSVLPSVQGRGRAGGASERLAPDWALGNHTMSSFKQHMFSPSGEVRILLTTWSLEKPPRSSEA